jgi:hypothetical protein
MYPSQLFVQTIIYNSPYRDKIWRGEAGDSTNLRSVDWNRGNPFVYKIEDIELLLQGKMLFARKFAAPIYEIESIIRNANIKCITFR